MPWWSIFYGALTLGVIIRSATTTAQTPNDPLGAGLILGALYLMSNLSHYAFRISDPYNRLYPACDTIALLIMAVAWRDSLTPWKASLLLLLVVDILLHGAFLDRTDTSRAARYQYDLTLNVVYLAQLGCVVLGTFSRD